MLRLFLFVFVLSANALAKPTEPAVYAGNTSIFCSQNDEGIQGVACEMVSAMASYQRYHHQIQLIPQARMLRFGKENSNSLLVPISRVPFREQHYQWILPLIEDDFVIASMQNKPIDVENIEQLKGITIGVVRGGLADSIISRYPSLTLVRNNSEMNLVEQLMLGRIKACACSWNAILYSYRKLGGKNEHLYKGLLLERVEIYLAGSPDLSADTIQQWQLAFDWLKSSGNYQRIIQDY